MTKDKVGDKDMGQGWGQGQGLGTCPRLEQQLAAGAVVVLLGADGTELLVAALGIAGDKDKATTSPPPRIPKFPPTPWPLRGLVPAGLVPALPEPVDGAGLQRRDDGTERGEVPQRAALLGTRGLSPSPAGVGTTPMGWTQGHLHWGHQPPPLA